MPVVVIFKRIKMTGILVVLLVGVSLCHGGYHATNNCYHYLDHAAKYKLCHDDRGYPTNEINLVLKSYPKMKEMFYEDDHPLPAPVSHYSKPPQSVCPHSRYTLHSYFYANKDCYVIYPEVQKITYVQCSTNFNRDCQRCASYGGVSKCDEDYDYQHVWAYCVPKDDRPKPVQPVLRPDPLQRARPRYPAPAEPKYYYNRIESPENNLKIDYVKSRPGTPQPKVVVPYAKMYQDPWNKFYRPYLTQHRWKRSYHSVPVRGTIERMKLYLPHHCGCKNFEC